MHVLLVEDDESLGRGIETALARWRHTSERARDGAEALAAAKDRAFDVIVLDLGLPKIDGLDVLRRLREGGRRTPVLVVTARDMLGDRVAGLDAGADDYLVKPFDLDELAARLRALHRRAGGIADPVLRVGALAIDSRDHAVSFEDKPLTLSPTEFLLLRTLAERAGRVVTREFLERVLFGADGVASNALEVHVHGLRRKTAPDLIRTARGFGYQLVAGERE